MKFTPSVYEVLFAVDHGQWMDKTKNYEDMADQTGDPASLG